MAPGHTLTLLMARSESVTVEAVHITNERCRPEKDVSTTHLEELNLLFLATSNSSMEKSRRTRLWHGTMQRPRTLSTLPSNETRFGDAGLSTPSLRESCSPFSISTLRISTLLERGPPDASHR
jgi:hypothetical protein